MKREELIERIDSIKPTEEQKDRMFQKLTKKKRPTYIFYVAAAAVLFLAVLTFPLSNMNVKNSAMKPLSESVPSESQVDSEAMADAKESARQMVVPFSFLEREQVDTAGVKKLPGFVRGEGEITLEQNEEKTLSSGLTLSFTRSNDPEETFISFHATYYLDGKPLTGFLRKESKPIRSLSDAKEEFQKKYPNQVLSRFHIVLTYTPRELNEQELVPIYVFFNPSDEFEWFSVPAWLE
ncbi:hypothetical protein [Guggenheimella bovis]